MARIVSILVESEILVGGRLERYFGIVRQGDPCCYPVSNLSINRVVVCFSASSLVSPVLHDKDLICA